MAPSWAPRAQLIVLWDCSDLLSVESCVQLHQALGQRSLRAPISVTRVFSQVVEEEAQLALHQLSVGEEDLSDLSLLNGAWGAAWLPGPFLRGKSEMRGSQMPSCPADTCPEGVFAHAERPHLPAKGLQEQEEGVGMSIELSQLIGSTFLAHLALSLCHSTHQQHQVAQDLVPLDLILWSSVYTDPLAQGCRPIVPMPTLDTDGSSTSSAHNAPVPPTVPTSFLFSLFGDHIPLLTQGLLLKSHEHPSTILPPPLTDLFFHCRMLKSTKGRTTGQLSAGSVWHSLCWGRRVARSCFQLCLASPA